ncbi:MAG: hypothetical protein RR222_10050, partial [Pseudomonas sp.]
MKKSALISSVEKYALEIEIFTLSRGFPAQISRSGAQKRIFSGQYVGDLEEPTFSTESADSR